MRKKNIFIVLLILIIAQIGFIYYCSAQSADVSNNNSAIFARIIARVCTTDFDRLDESQQALLTKSYQHIARKLAHLIEFFCLGALMALLFRNTAKRGIPAAFFITVAIASLDELHQTLTEGRNGQLSDVLIDAGSCMLGIAAALTLLFVIRYARSRR